MIIRAEQAGSNNINVYCDNGRIMQYTGRLIDYTSRTVTLDRNGSVLVIDENYRIIRGGC